MVVVTASALHNTPIIFCGAESSNPAAITTLVRELGQYLYH